MSSLLIEMQPLSGDSVDRMSMFINTRRGHAAFAMILGCLAVGCASKKLPDGFFFSTTVRCDHGSSASKMDRCDIQRFKEWVTAGLRRQKNLRWAKRSTASQRYMFRLDVRFRELDDEGNPSEGGETRVVVIQARAKRAEKHGLFSPQIDLIVPIQGSNDLKQALVRVGSEVAYQVVLAHSSTKTLLKNLKSKDLDRLLATIEITALRRANQAVKPLITLLRHRREAVRDRALGALIAIGDRSAVRAITRLKKFSDTNGMAKVIDGIATLGGQEAQSYLEFVASGHPNEQIRQLASVALKRMK